MQAQAPLQFPEALPQLGVFRLQLPESLVSFRESLLQLIDPVRGTATLWAHRLCFHPGHRSVLRRPSRELREPIVMPTATARQQVASGSALLEHFYHSM